MVHWWLVGGCCRLLVGWSICRSSQGPSFRAGQRQGNGRATPGGQRRGWGGARAQTINQVRHHVSHGSINSRLNCLAPLRPLRRTPLGAIFYRAYPTPLTPLHPRRLFFLLARHQLRDRLEKYLHDDHCYAHFHNCPIKYPRGLADHDRAHRGANRYGIDGVSSRARATPRLHLFVSLKAPRRDSYGNIHLAGTKGE